jgi:nitrous oxidase accessory protein
MLASIPENDVVKAEAQTIVVPDDYATIQWAIGNASEGDTIFVKKGTYEGLVNQTLVINKTISLIGEDPETTIINLYPPYNEIPYFPNPPILNYSDSIIINANNVKLEGFTIVPTPTYSQEGRGVIVSGDRTQIIDCIITGRISVLSSYNNITRNTIVTRFALMNSSFNVIVGNSLAATFLEYADSNVISNNTCMGFTVGWQGRTSSNNTITKNIMDGGNYPSPFSWGISITSGANNIVHDNYIANYHDVGYGGWGVIFSTNTVNNTFYRNVVMDNDENVDSSTSGNFWDNGVEGNYWSDYDGTDNNGDGIGDTPYIINENNQDNYPLMAPIKSFDAGTWEWTQYNVDVVSNSTVSDFRFNPEGAFIRFNVEGETGTMGFCRVTIPKDLLHAEDNWNVLVNETSVTPTVNVDTTNTYIYFTYKHSTNTIEIIGTTAIPEFPLWVILPLFLVATFVVVILRKRLSESISQ